MNALTSLEEDFADRDQRRFRVKVGVFLILLKEDQILCLKRAQTGIEDGLYVVPMGCLQEGETPLEAVIREAEEEVGALLKPEDLRLAHTLYRKHVQPDGYIFYQQDLFFAAQKFSGIICNLEPHKADEVSFYPLNKPPSPLSPFIKHALSCILKEIPYSEFGFTGEENGHKAGYA